MLFFSPSRSTRACYEATGEIYFYGQFQDNRITDLILSSDCATRCDALETHLWHQVLEGVHDLGALGLLVVGEAAGDDDDRRKHDAQVQLQQGREDSVS